MPDESTTPDLLELMRSLAEEAASEEDFDTADSYYAPDAVWNSSRTGVGSFEGAAAIRVSSRTGVVVTRSGRLGLRSCSISATASCSRLFAKRAVRSALLATCGSARVGSLYGSRA
jgi:hypothetical protein